MLHNVSHNTDVYSWVGASPAEHVVTSHPMYGWRGECHHEGNACSLARELLVAARAESLMSRAQLVCALCDDAHIGEGLWKAQ